MKTRRLVKNKTFVRYAPYVKTGIQVARAAKKAYGFYKRYAAKKAGRKEVIDRVTAQKDYARINVRRKGGSRKQKKWRRFRRSVQRVIASGPMRVLNKTGWVQFGVSDTELNLDRPGSSGTIKNWQIGRQSVFNLSLCAYSQLNSDQDNDDLNELNAILNGSQTTADGITATTPIYVKSALWELMISSHRYDATNINSYYCDIYHYTVKKTAILDVNDIILAAQAQVQDGTTPTAGTNYATGTGFGDYGWTPYQYPKLMKHINIYKKERYLIPSGGTVQVEKRISINKEYRKDQNDVGLETVENKIKKGLTHGMIIVAYGCPEGANSRRITGAFLGGISWNKTIYFGRGNADTNLRQDLEWRTYEL